VAGSGGLLTILVGALLSLGADDVVRAGKDVPVPERLHYVPPEYPSVARGVFPPVMGIIVLDVVLNEEGRPVDIKVLRGTPLIDRAAIEAVRQWRYRPTLRDGRPQQVVLLEVVDVFPDEGAKAGYFARMLKDRKEARTYRLLAIQKLKAIGALERSVLKALQKATEDPDEAVRNAATQALRDLATSGR
jgi:TonB family protein